MKTVKTLYVDVKVGPYTVEGKRTYTIVPSDASTLEKTPPRETDKYRHYERVVQTTMLGEVVIIDTFVVRTFKGI